MRHRKNTALLNRPSDQRKALVRSLITSLAEHGKIQTTQAKAKALKSAAEKLITRIKSDNPVNAIRTSMACVYTEEASRKLVEYAQKTEKNSGFVRCTKLDFRDGDNAMTVQVELL